MVSQTTVPEAIAQQVAGGNAQDKAREQEAAASLVEKRLAIAIQQIRSDPRLGNGDKDRLVEQLYAAAANNDLAAIETALTRISIQTGEQIDDTRVDRSMDAAYEYSKYYAEYEDYSHEGRTHIDRTWQAAMSKSTTLRDISTQLEAQPKELVEHALDEQKANRRKLRAMMEDPEYEPYHEQIKQIRGYGLAGPEVSKLIEDIEKGVPKEVIQERIDAARTKQVEFADLVVNGRDGQGGHFQNIPKESQQYLNEHYGKDGKIDMRVVTEEWKNYSAKQRDEAYKAMAESGNDISKLTPEQQKIIHLSQVMIPVDIGTVQKGALEIIERDKGLAAQLANQDLSVTERTQLLDQAMRQNGVSTSDGAVYRSSLRNVVGAIDETEKEGNQYGSAGFMAAFAGNFRENLEEIVGRKPAQVADIRAFENEKERQAAQQTAPQNTYSYAEVERYIATTRAEDGYSAEKRDEWGRVLKTLTANEPQTIAPLVQEKVEPLAPSKLALDVAALPPLPSLGDIGVTGGVSVVENGNPPGGKAPQGASAGKTV